MIAISDEPVSWIRVKTGHLILSQRLALRLGAGHCNGGILLLRPIEHELLTLSRAGPSSNEADHRPGAGVISLWSAQKLIADIDTMQMIKKGQLNFYNAQPMSQPPSAKALPLHHLATKQLFFGPSILSRHNRYFAIRVALGLHGFT